MTATNNAEVNKEFQSLKNRAKLLGIEYSPEVTLSELKELVNGKLTQEDENTNNNFLNGEAGTSAVQKKEKTLRELLQEEELKLIRVRITNMDPKKKDLPGEILTIANEYLGTIRKFIPYGEVTDNGYHIPYIMYKHLENKRFLNIRTKKGKNGTPIAETTWAKEFAIEVLPPLIAEEIAKLATAQIAAGSLERD